MTGFTWPTGWQKSHLHTGHWEEEEGGEGEGGRREGRGQICRHEC